MSDTRIDEVNAIKDRQRHVWALGDYPAVATHIAKSPPEDVLNAIAPVAGLDLLDVATGSGNLAIPAAAAGARVTGVDICAPLLEAARARDTEGAVTWVEGDAEALPFPDAGFDRVTSLFGVIFAPRAEVAAAELLRVCRPGGAIGLANWAIDGYIGRLFALTGRFLPPGPEWVTPPPRWGDEAFLRELFADRAELSVTRRTNRWEFPSVQEFADYFDTRFGPAIAAEAALGDQVEAYRAAQMELYHEFNQATDGRCVIEGDYLVVTVRPR
jgi:2-polyprenyl-6-hydroxyphenyl methylase/3-demethylubiquinone-9 3-methyltransferase